MLVFDLKKFVGKVVALDLVNQQRPVVRIERIDETTGSPVVVGSNPLLFIPTPTGRPGEIVMRNVPYGAPLFETKTLRLEPSQILTVFDLPEEMEAAYTTAVSGLVMPGKPGLIIP